MNTNVQINLLLVEDDRDLSASITDYLQVENISCDHAYHGKSGLDLCHGKQI